MSAWSIIIPYRDREEHLSKFVSHYNGLFPEVPIIVVEQQQNSPFNRAKLLNVGFLEEGKNYEWSAYHDVDMYVFPEYAHCYSFPNMPTHIATCCEQFGYRQPYPEFSGGVTLISKEHMEKSNGFSNHFWSRNAEDDEMRNNLNSCGFAMQHIDCYFHCADHERYYDPKLFRKNLSLLKRGRYKDPRIDGLTSCTYRVTNREEKEGYTLIQVNI